MTREETYQPYSKKALERLGKILKQYGVSPWVNPVTNSISIKRQSFDERQAYPDLR